MIEREGIERAPCRSVVVRHALRATRLLAERLHGVFDEQRRDAVGVLALHGRDECPRFDAGPRPGDVDAGGLQALTRLRQVIDSPRNAPQAVGLAHTFLGLLRASADLDGDVSQAEEEDPRVALRERTVEGEPRAERVRPQLSRHLHVRRQHDGVVHALHVGTVVGDRGRRRQCVRW